jgi:competence protein ComEC
MLEKNVGLNRFAIACNSNFSYAVFSPNNIDYNDPNTVSYVTILSFNGVKVLLGGDLPHSGWINLLERKDFMEEIDGTTVFKVPHHGRKDGCSEELFKYICPQLCIISDKRIDETNKNTVATDWYSSHTRGIVFNDGSTRKVVSTRKDGPMFIEVNDDGCSDISLNTMWRK